MVNPQKMLLLTRKKTTLKCKVVPKIVYLKREEFSTAQNNMYSNEVCNLNRKEQLKQMYPCYTINA